MNCKLTICPENRKFTIKKFRMEGQEPSRWLPKNYISDVPEINRLHTMCLNSPLSIQRLIYENETKKNVKFLLEGLIRTYPTQKFADVIKGLIEDIVPLKLRNLRFCDVLSNDGDTTRLLDYIEADKQHDGVSPCVSFLVPCEVGCDDIETQLNGIVDDSHLFGYDLSSIDKFNHDLKPEVNVYVFQFEARFCNWKFEMSDILYHVSPMSNLKKISRKGLVPRTESSEFEYLERVYLFNKCPLRTIIKYGVTKTEDTEESGFCLFTIKKENLVNDPKYKNGKMTFYVDSVFQDDSHLDIDAMFTYNTVPPYLIDDECMMFYKDDFSHPKNVKFK